MHLAYTGAVSGGHLVREARKRAGMTQRELAAATGLSQPTITRIESGAIEASLEQIGRLIAACGLELRVSLVAADQSDWSVALHNLRLDPETRVRQHQAALRFARAGREALAKSRTDGTGDRARVSS